MNELQLMRFMDHQQIEQVLIAYCVHLDNMELNALADLFTTDCTVDYGDDPHLKSQGAKDLARSLERMWRWNRTSHHLSNVMVEFDDEDNARAISYVHAWHERADGSTATILGQYRDRLQRHSGRWLIHHRKMLMNGSDAGFTVPIHPLGRKSPPPGWTAPQIGPASHPASETS